MKNGSLTVFLVIFIVCLSVSIASAERVFSGWVYDGDKVVVDNTIYHAFLTHEKLTLYSDVASFSLFPNSTRKIMDYKFCNKKIEFDSTKQEYRAYLYITKKVPVVEVSESVNKNIYLTGDEIKFRVRIKNSGELEASNISYELNLPKEFKIYKLDKELINKSNTIIWKGDIKKKSEADFEFTVLALKSFKGTINSRTVYWEEGEPKELFSDGVSFEVRPVIDARLDLEYKKMHINHNNVARITLNNIGDKKIKISKLYLYFPADIRIKKYDSHFYEISPNTFVIDDVEIGARGKTFYRFEFYLTKSGEKTIQYRIFYSTNNQNFSLDGFKLVDGYFHDIVVFTTIRKNERLMGYESKLVGVSIQNPVDYIRFNNCSISLKSPLTSNVSFYIKEIPEFSSVRIFWKNITLANPRALYYSALNVSIKCYTNFSEPYSFSKAVKFSIKPYKGLKITNTLPASYIEQETLSNKVMIENPAPTEIKKIKVYDILPEEFKFKYGTLSSAPIIKASTKQTVLSYEFTVPAVVNETRFNITTLVSYMGPDNKTYYINKTSTITIKPRKNPLKVRLSYKKKPYMGEIVPIDLEIKNIRDFSVKNVTITAPTSVYFDFIGERAYIEKLNPGERIFIKNKFYLKPKQAGRFALKGYNISYLTNHYNSFRSSDIHLEVDKAQFTGPRVFITRSLNASETTTAGRVRIIINITNEGDQMLHSTLYDLNKKWNLIMNPHSSTSITYETTFESAGVHKLKPAYLEYLDLGYTLRSYSNSNNISIIEPLKIDSESKKIEVAEKTMHNENKAVHTNHAHKGIVEKLIYIIKSILTWRLR